MEKCRACLSTEEKLVSFDSTSIESYNLLTSLCIKQSDGLPQALCELCFNSIETFMTFRLNCIHSEEILKAELATQAQKVSSKRSDKKQSTFTNYFEVKKELVACGADGDFDADDGMDFNDDDDDFDDGNDSSQLKNEGDMLQDDEIVNMDCVICNRPLAHQNSLKVKKRGLINLIRFSKMREDGLADLFAMVEEICLHEACRKKYLNPHKKLKQKIKSPPIEADINMTDLDDSNFNFTTKCFICCKDYKQTESSVLKGNVLYKMRSQATQDVLVKALKNYECKKHERILKWIENINLCDVEALYHKKCFMEVMMPEKKIADSKIWRPPKKNENKGFRPNYIKQDHVKIDYGPKGFPFKTHCFYCGQEADYIKVNKKMDPKEHIFMITKEKTQATVVSYLKKFDVEMNSEVLDRIKNVDLRRVKARYHSTCFNQVRFQTASGLGKGRPVTESVKNAMDIIVKYIAESGRNVFDMDELKLLLVHDEHIPDNRTIKKNLEERLGDLITITAPKFGSKPACVIIHDLLTF